MAQAWDEKKEQELTENKYLIKKGVYASFIRYNKLPGEIFFLRLDYYGGSITFTINETGYKISVEDDKLGDFTLINKIIDNSNFSQQIGKILSGFGDSVYLEYIETFTGERAKANGEEIQVDRNKMLNLIGKLFHTTLSYIKNNFSFYHFTLNFDKVFVYYTYMFRKPDLKYYKAYSSEYIYDVFYPPLNSLTIYKTKTDGEPEEIFKIRTDIYKYSRHILSDVIKLVLQSKIKDSSYTIQIEGKNAKINGKLIKGDDNVVKDIIDSAENQIRFIINTLKDKLDKLEQDFLST